MKNTLLATLAAILLHGVIHAQCNLTTNLALGKTAFASSLENSSYPASAAVDGNSTGTRWSSAFADPQWIYVDLGSPQALCEVVLQWETAYATAFHIDGSNDASTWTTLANVTGNTFTTSTISVTGTYRYVRMYGTTRATSYGYSLWEFQVFGPGSAGCSTNLAPGKTTTVSSTESTAYPGSYAVDANTGTRWSSAFSDPQWIVVDLGALYTICSVELDWETAYGSAFTIDFSSNGSSWTTMTSVTGNASQTNNLSVSGTARYVRMYGTARGTSYGYSLWEFKIFGSSSTLPLTWLSFGGRYDENAGAVDLNWTTAGQAGAASFQVERQGGAGDFVAIGSMPAQKTQSDLSAYRFFDEAPPEGTNLYRIRQVDADGRFLFSPVVAVKVKGAAAAVRAWPNPTTGQMTVELPPGQTILQLRVLDAAGRSLSDTRPAASNRVPVDLGPYAPGLYYLQVVTADGSRLLKAMRR